MISTLVATLLSLGLAGSAWGDASVAPGEVIINPPTLICLGFQWPIEGDDNRNATVSVNYRILGQDQWRDALPLLRIGGEVVGHGQSPEDDYFTPHMFAGSIFDLEPDTEYEVRLEMTDPDGVSGNSVQQLTVRTRPEPKAFEGGRTLHVYPVGYPKDKKQQPAFTGLRAAYRKVEPGDIILVHAGVYRGDLKQYAEPLGLTFHGTYNLVKKGTAERPIVIRAAGDGQAVFDGAGAYRLFDVMAADHHHFEGLVIRNCDVAFFAGSKGVTGSSGLVVRNCVLENVGAGVYTTYAGSRDFYIADNEFVGRAEPWLPDDQMNNNRGYNSPVHSYYAIMVYGQGHVICYNRVSRFHDGIDIASGPPEEPQDLKCVAIDIYNNDIFAVNDDFIETDGGVHNIRVLRNRCFNSGTCGVSAQTVYGGPAYFIRNVLFHVARDVSMKFVTRPSGLIVYHNTFVTGSDTGRFHSNFHARNNLFMGSFQMATLTHWSSLDHNGYAQLPIRFGGPFDREFWGTGGRGEVLVRPVDRIRTYESLQAFHEATGWEANGVELDFSIFVKAYEPTHDNTLYKVESVDLRLTEANPAIDAGCPLANVNEGFSGDAPDLGAYEFGAELPHYGPRHQQ